MVIGCPKEIKPQEGRVSLTPAGVDALIRAGHTVYIQQGAGLQSGFADEEYVASGAQILSAAEELYSLADMIVKVKEPLPQEYGMLREGQVLFTYLHLAPDTEQTEALLERKVIGIAYETVQMADGSLPLLAPMSGDSRTVGSSGRRAFVGIRLRRSGNTAERCTGCGARQGGYPGRRQRRNQCSKTGHRYGRAGYRAGHQS